MSTEGFLIDASVRRQVFIERFTNGRIFELEKIVQAMSEAINGALVNTDLDNPVEVDLVLRRIDGIISDSMSDIGGSIISAVEGVTEAELEFLEKLLGQTLEIQPLMPTFAMVEAAIYGQVLASLAPDESLTLSEALQQFDSNKHREIKRIIDEGLMAGRTVTDITDKIHHITETRQKHQVRSLVRTAINHASNMVSRAAYRENSGVISGYQWVSTLDSRTTLICAGRDGRTYALGSNIYPPAHWGCRSRTIPLIADEYDKDGLKGTRPQKGDKVGFVSAGTDFDSWLRKQSASFQDEYFSQFTNGEELAKLFRQGKMPVQKFRNELGKQYTLDELRALDPVAFDRANIEAPSGG